MFQVRRLKPVLFFFVFMVILVFFLECIIYPLVFLYLGNVLFLGLLQFKVTLYMANSRD